MNSIPFLLSKNLTMILLHIINMLHVQNNAKTHVPGTCNFGFKNIAYTCMYTVYKCLTENQDVFVQLLPNKNI